jgi:NO-binding membrane sensor protein with MHYT domain
MIDDLHREADALPTLRTRSWVILGLLISGIGLWAVLHVVVQCMVDVAIAVGWPV